MQYEFCRHDNLLSAFPSGLRRAEEAPPFRFYL
jgi:hypothetical protein